MARDDDPNHVPRMHPDEVDVDERLVRTLLADHLPDPTLPDPTLPDPTLSDPTLPDLAGLPLRRVTAWGTDHVIFRLGDELSVRLPKVGWADGQGEREQRWLRALAPRLGVDVPVPVALGRPGAGYPFRWYVTPWIDGTHPDPDDGAALPALAEELAEFVLALRACPTDGAPAVRPGRRGGPLAAADEPTRTAAERLRAMVRDPEAFPGLAPDDVDALTACWQDGVDAPAWDGTPVWVHGDLSDGNLLRRDGRLAGVIDWSGLAVGDPAVELMCAWHLFDGPSRQVLRTALDVDDDTWRRGRAWAVSAALQALPYYRDTNPDIVDRSLRTARAVLGTEGCTTTSRVEIPTGEPPRAGITRRERRRMPDRGPRPPAGSTCTGPG